MSHENYVELTSAERIEFSGGTHWLCQMVEALRAFRTLAAGYLGQSCREGARGSGRRPPSSGVACRVRHGLRVKEAVRCGVLSYHSLL